MRIPRGFLTALFALGLLLPMARGIRAQEQATSPHKQLVQQFIEACNTKRYSRLGEILQKNFHRHCQATPMVTVKSLDEFIDFLSADASTFPDAHIALNQLIEEGDRVAFWGAFTGTQKGALGPFPPSMKKVVLDVSGVFRIEAGKIAELWITWDNMAVFTQLELKPAEQAPADAPDNE